MLPIQRKTRSSGTNLFNEFFNNDYHPVFFDWDDCLNLQTVNINECKKDCRVELAAPELTKSYFKVSLDDNILIISSEKKVSNETKEKDTLRREFSYSMLSRCFALPETAADKCRSLKQVGQINYLKFTNPINIFRQKVRYFARQVHLIIK